MSGRRFYTGQGHVAVRTARATSRLRQLRDEPDRLALRRAHDHRADLRLLPHLEPFADARGRPDEVQRVHELVRYRGDRLAALPREEQILNLVRLRLEANAPDVLAVEVLLPRAHPADVEREAHLERHPARVEIV